MKGGEARAWIYTRLPPPFPPLPHLQSSQAPTCLTCYQPPTQQLLHDPTTISTMSSQQQSVQMNVEDFENAKTHTDFAQSLIAHITGCKHN